MSVVVNIMLSLISVMSPPLLVVVVCLTRPMEGFKNQDAFIRQEHNIIYNHMNENNIRLETSTKEQKEPLS